MLHRKACAVGEVQAAAEVCAEQPGRATRGELVEQGLAEDAGTDRIGEHLRARGTAAAVTGVQFDDFDARNARQQGAQGSIAAHHAALGAGQVQRDAFLADVEA